MKKVLKVLCGMLLVAFMATSGRAESGLTFGSTSITVTGGLGASVGYGDIYSDGGTQLLASVTDYSTGVLYPIDMGKLLGVGYFYFPNLKVCGNLVFTQATLRDLQLPELELVTDGISINGYTAPAIRLPKLRRALHNATFIAGGPKVTSALELSALEYVENALSVQGFIAMTSLDLPVLAEVGSTFTVATSTNISTLSAPQLVTAGAALTLTGPGTLTDLTGFMTTGTMKTISGTLVSISSHTLSEASVDHILEVIASLDGTNGTTEFGAGKTLDLAGVSSYTGTGNATPSVTGQGHVTTIRARGAIVKVN